MMTPVLQHWKPYNNAPMPNMQRAPANDTCSRIPVFADPITIFKSRAKCFPSDFLWFSIPPSNSYSYSRIALEPPEQARTSSSCLNCFRPRLDE